LGSKLQYIYRVVTWRNWSWLWSSMECTG